MDTLAKSGAEANTVMRLPMDQLEDTSTECSQVAPGAIERQSLNAGVTAPGLERRSGVLLWIISFVLVAACHGIGALALMKNVSSTPDADFDAVVILDLPEALTPSPARDLPPGPPILDEVSPTPQPAEENKPQQREAEVAPRVDAEPRPPEAPADMAVPVPQPEPATPPQPSTEEVHRNAPTPARGPPKSVVRWQSQLGRHIERFMRYPAGVLHGGTVFVYFTIDRHGRLVRSSVVQSAGSTALDQEALAMLARAQPLPPPPPEATDAELTVASRMWWKFRRSLRVG